MTLRSTLRTTVSGFDSIFACRASTRALVGASRQSKRRSTVIGRMTLRYSLRLYGPRSRLQMLQMKPASREWVSGLNAESKILTPKHNPRVSRSGQVNS